MKTYQEQAKEIKELTDRITLKAQKFADTQDERLKYFGELLWVIDELKDIDKFLK